MVKREDILSIIFSFALSIILIFGDSVYKYHSLYLFKYNLIGSFLKFLFYFFIFFLIFKIISFITKFNFKVKKINIKNIHLIIMILLIGLIYSLCFLSYWPGILAYDSYSQIAQAIDYYPMYGQHPILHTLFIKFCYNIIKPLNKIHLMSVVYSFFQITIILFFYLYLFKWIQNKIGSNSTILTFLYFLLIPTFHIASFLITKDILFSIFFCLYTMKLYDSIDNPSKCNIILSILFGIISALFRNNVVYALALSFVIWIIFKFKIKLISHLLVVIILSIVINNLLLKINNSNSSPVRESLSIPIVQLAKVYNENDLSYNEQNEIKKYLSHPEYYNPRLSDGAKATFNDEYFTDNKSNFFKLYFNLLLKYPEDFVVAFLDLNLPSWYLFAQFPDEFSKVDYISTYIYDMDFFPVKRNSKLPVLNSFYENYAKFQNPIMLLPILKQFFSISFPFYLLIFCLFISLKNKNKNAMYVLILYMMLFFTHLLGPVASLRYNFVYYYAMPILLTISLKNN